MEKTEPAARAAVRTFATTSARGLDRDHPALRLWEKAKKFGVWNPSGIDLAQDREDWAALDEVEKDLLLALTALFVAGEESVTQDLLPLVRAIAGEGRLEEEMFLTSFLWEEAKHTDFFRRVMDEVFEVEGDLAGYHGSSYRKIFYEELPGAMEALAEDPSPVVQARASVTYNMIVEGVLAETGYHAYYSMLERNDIMPGLREGIGYLKRDESRHLAYGVFLLSRLAAEHEEVWPGIQTRMNELLQPAIGVVAEVLEGYDPIPFGLRIEDFTNYALSQFGHRMARIERGAKVQSVEQVYASAGDLVDDPGGQSS